MNKVTSVKDREGDTLQIVCPGLNLGKTDLLDSNQIFTSAPTSTQAIYIYCSSLIHVTEGDSVTDLDAPIDARGGVYLSSNRGEKISVKLLDGQDPATVWIHEVK